MSAQSNRAPGTAARWAGVGAALALALLLGGCGASAPARPEAALREPVGAAPAQASDEAKSGHRKGRKRGGGESHGETAQADVPEGAQRDFAAAVASMQAGNWADAEARLARLTAQYPELPGPYVNAAIAYAHDGRDDEALAALDKALAIAPGHAAANNELGILLRKRGDFAGAEKAYRKALETEPSYALALYNLGVLLDVYLRRQSEALALYEQYQSLLPQPDETVARWIIDLKRRVGGGDPEARIAREAAE